MKTLELADGGRVTYLPGFLAEEPAWAYWRELRESCAWEQQPAIFGQRQPRLTASYGDPGTTYLYSGTRNEARPWTACLSEIREQVEAVAGSFNFCLLNRYRSGADSVAWHADDEPGLGPVIASVSLGAARRFCLRHNSTRETREWLLEHGSLLIMSGTLQTFWKHQVPKTRRSVGERINLTFRQITPAGIGPSVHEGDFSVPQS